MEPDLIRTARVMCFLGVPAEVHESLGSTNDEALRRAREGAPEGLVVLADHQTSGRGRLGRNWFDDAGRSLMFSILLRPSIPLRCYPLLALALASSIADAGAEIVGEPLTVKWPNDVLHRGRKVCGILAESRALRPGELPVLVLGAGVNVNYQENDFPAELRDRASSLQIVGGGGKVPMGALFGAILLWFVRELEFARDGDPNTLLARVRPRLPEDGARVRVVLGDRTVDGDLLNVTETGALRVRDPASGRVETLAAGVLE